jgi:O-methyltransferase involved in polyketide biosynthesis
MKKNQACFTAILVADMRACHSIHTTSKIFDDYLAYNLILNEKLALIKQYWTEHCWTWDKQLTDSKHKTSRSEQTITSKSLTQAAHEFAGTFNNCALYAGDGLEKAVNQE